MFSISAAVVCGQNEHLSCRTGVCHSSILFSHPLYCVRAWWLSRGDASPLLP